MNNLLLLVFVTFLASSLAADLPTFCVSSDVGVDKCEASGLHVTCEVHKNCADEVAAGKYKLALATANDLTKNAENVKIVLVEKYQGLAANVRYYGVAVVKKDAALKLKELKGKKTCHTGAGKTAGWNIPIGYFLSEKIMDQKKDAYESAANFFEACCVPGLPEDVSSDVKQTLCKLCKTDCTTNSPYADYNGAFQCMNESAGEVAFVKHDIAPQDSDDFELLCQDGSKKAVNQYENCNVGERPAGAIITGKRASADDIAMYRRIILAVPIKNLTDQGIVKGIESFTTYDDTTLKYLGNYKKYVDAVKKEVTSGASSVTSWLLSFQVFAALLYFYAF